jgi:6-phosphogluconolactonase (cycloisomerase 2 family)
VALPGKRQCLRAAIEGAGMNIGKWARLLLAAAPLLAGCANFWQAPTTTTTTTTTTTLSGGIFYVLNVETSQIVAYDIVSGVLTKIATYATPSTPLALTVSPNGGFLYLSTTNGIYIYSVSSTGTLAIGNSSGVISSDQAQAMRVDATNTWLVEAISGSAYLYAIPLSASTGLATSSTEQHTTLSATTVQQLTISPDNKYVFVAQGTGGTAVVPFTSANTNPLGTAGNIPVKGTGGAALSVAVDASSRLFYIGETVATSGSNSGGVRAFKFASLPSLAELSASPYASQGLAPYSILPTASGDYVYVANRQTSSSSSGVIAGFSITSSNSTYALTALSSTATAGTNPVGLAQDSTGNFILAVSVGGGPDLEAYIFDTTTAGQLDATITSTTGTDPVQASAVVAVP